MRNFHTFRKICNSLYRKQLPVRTERLLLLHIRLFLHHLFILFHTDDIGVITGNLRIPGMASCAGLNLDIKNITAPGFIYANRQAALQLFCLLFLFLCHGSQNFQSFFRICRHNPGAHCGRNPPLAAGTGHYHAFYIFNNICAGPHFHRFRLCSQRPGCNCRPICNGDGLRTSHGRNQFFLQYSHIFIINLLFHILFPLNNVYPYRILPMVFLFTV